MEKMLRAIILSCLVFVFFNVHHSNACTNILVSKGASADGSVMITYNADAGGFMDPLYYKQAKDHKPEDSLEIYDWDSGKYLGKIKQVLHTYQVVGSMNEYQVSIGETTFGGRPELRDTNALIDYGSLMWLGMHRAKTAREAIKVMTDLVAEYGYYSVGESFSVSDANEAWIMEMISKGPKEKGAVWVARRVPEGYICAHANHPRIREFPLNDPENCIYAKDVITFAEKMGYYKKSDGPFKFCEVYAPLDPGSALYCEGRIWSIFRRAAPSLNLSPDYWRAVKGAEPYPLFIKPDKKLSVKDVMALMRDHFEGTEFDMTKGLAAGPFGCPYRWKGLEWKITGDTVNSYGWERPVSTQQTAFSFVSQSRSWLPREVGGCFWYAVDDTYSDVYMPLYCSMTSVPYTLTCCSIKEFSFDSAWWIFNLVSNLAYTKYSYMIPDIQKVQKELEDKFHENQAGIEKDAAELINKKPKDAIKYLNDYSNRMVDLTVNTWFDLWKKLVVKYNDGYINDVTVANGRHPKNAGYGDEFFRKFIQERPGYYDVKWKEPVKKEEGTK